MPSSPTYKRDYKREYENQHASREAKKKRASRNKARRMMEKEDKVHKGDGRDVDHRRPLSKGGSNEKENLRVAAQLLKEFPVALKI